MKYFAFVCISLELSLNSVHFLLFMTEKATAREVSGLSLKQYQEIIDKKQSWAEMPGVIVLL